MWTQVVSCWKVYKELILPGYVICGVGVMWRDFHILYLPMLSTLLSPSLAAAVRGCTIMSILSDHSF